VTEDDQGQVERSLQGDHEAFEALVRRYQRMIYSLAYRMTGSATEAEDLTQETFIRAHEQLHAFRAESRFSSWLYRIAVNHCLNWRKRIARREQAHDDWQAQQDPSPSSNRAVTQAVQEALLKLKPKQRAALVLTVYDGLNHAEAARVLNCSETTVSWRIFAARRKLKSLLKHVQAGGASHE
jgi:RNA polymerase sigma-70 factor (ECF subfamily)